VNNKPSLRQYTITGLTGLSLFYKVKIRAYNYAGNYDSPPLVFQLAAVPDTPTQAPYSSPSQTNGS
jgi:hypothetical protein